MLETIVAEVAVYLTSRGLDRVRGVAASTQKQQALERVFRIALQAFRSELPAYMADYADPFEKFFRKFFRDEVVVNELTALVVPGRDIEIDLPTLIYRAQELGFDFTTVPEVSFGRAVRSFVAAFWGAVQNDETLLPFLSHLEIQRLRSTTERLETMIAVLIAHQERNIQPVRTVVNQIIVAQPKPIDQPGKVDNSQDTVPYEHPSQQYIRYVILGVADDLPETVDRDFRMLSMADANWVDRWEDSIEVVLSSEDHVAIGEMFQQASRQLQMHPGLAPRERWLTFYDLAIDRLEETLQHRLSGLAPTIHPIANQLRQAGMPYIVIGAAPELASFYDIARITLHPGGYSSLMRGNREILFESLEDAQEVPALISQALREANGDPTKYRSNLIRASASRLKANGRRKMT